MTTQTEKITIVHAEDWSLAIGTSTNPDDYVEIRTHGKHSEEWLGKISFCITKEEAKTLGAALLEYCK